MRDLSGIIDEILQKCPGLTKENILSLIQEKKKKFGSGYLTDTGAAYLVAAD
ncbi:MAG: single-stranded DNA-binding protein, partial [Nitrososphaeria archaeon]|nr:single-stranded DNA-binding protein [Nitrososphaeria archaeon]